MPKKKTGSSKTKFFNILVPLHFTIIVIISLIFTAGILYQAQTRQYLSASAENTIPLVGTLGSTSEYQTSSKSRVCTNGKCVTCDSTNSCVIKCDNGNCTCNGGSCDQFTNPDSVVIDPKRSPRITQPNSYPGFDKPGITKFPGQNEAGSTSSSSISKSCINGKCFTCSSSSSCEIQCSNDSCTCSPGPCQESTELTGQDTQDKQASETGQITKSQPDFFKQIINQVSKFFQDIFKSFGQN